MSKMEKAKAAAEEEQKAQNFDKAIEAYAECLNFDPLNVEYN